MSESGDQSTPAASERYPDAEGNKLWWDGHAWRLAAPAPAVAPKHRLSGPGKASIVVLAVLVIAAVFFIVDQSFPGHGSGSSSGKQAMVIDRADGCQRFYDLMLAAYTEHPVPTNDVLWPRFAELRDAAREHDQLLASDLQDIVDSKTAADVSNTTQIIFRRCMADQDISQEQITTLADAAQARLN